MSNNDNWVSSLLLGLLTLIFVTLKLTDVIDWSWWWVLSPLWIPVLIALIVIGLIGIVVAIKLRKINKKTKWEDVIDKMNKASKK